MAKHPIVIFSDQVRGFTVITEGQLINRSLTLTTGALRHIDLTKGPVFQMWRFSSTAGVCTAPEAMQHTLVQVTPELQKWWLVLTMQGIRHQVDPRQQLLLLFCFTCLGQQMPYPENQFVQIQWFFTGYQCMAYLMRYRMITQQLKTIRRDHLSLINLTNLS